MILVVSFGTSYNETRAKNIDAIENDIAKAFPDHEIRRAFTSGMIIRKLQKRDGVKVDTVTEALEKMADEGIKEVVVQPTHLMAGEEFDIMVNDISKLSGRFSSVKIGRPLLTSDKDIDDMADMLIGITSRAEDECYVFMGHGTEHNANAVYASLQETLDKKGIRNIFIGTVEAVPTKEDMIAKAKALGARKVVIQPLMVVAGDHATNDLAGDEADSWKNTFISEGFEVECILKGLGEFSKVRDMYVEHVREML